VLGRNEIYVKVTENDGRVFWRGWNCFIIGRVDGKYNTQEHAFFSNIYCMTLCRRFFITNRGYLGLGPRNMQIGDEIHIVAGGSFPLVFRKASHKRSIRPANPTYTLVGDCYLHGVMGGEEQKTSRNKQRKLTASEHTGSST
jgi:hypothetical protein